MSSFMVGSASLLLYDTMGTRTPIPNATPAKVSSKAPWVTMVTQDPPRDE